MRSKLSIPLRIFIVIVGAIVVFIGFAWRDFEETKPGGPGHFLGMEEDGVATVYGMHEDADKYGVEPIGSEWGVFYYSDEGETRTELFRGSEEAAHAFFDEKTSYVAFVGTPEEVQAWEEARLDELTNFVPMNLTIAAGVLVILAGLGLGWRRSPGRPARDESPQDLVGV